MTALHPWSVRVLLRCCGSLLLCSGFCTVSVDCRGQESAAAEASQVDEAMPSDEAATHPELGAEIIRRMDEDQQARLRWIELMNNTEGKTPEQVQDDLQAAIAAVNEIDQRNREWLSAQIVEHGWPGKSLVGEPAAHAAWLLVQHADSDRKFQEECLERMKAAAEGEVSVVDIAYLTDRVLVGKGEPQIYGTQCHEVDGKFEPQECIEPEKLDERRASIGLPPIREYLEQIEAVYRGNRE